MRSNPGVLKLAKGTVIQKVHWNDMDELELPVVEKKVVPKKELSVIGYFINGEPSTKEEVEALDTLSIESVNVIRITSYNVCYTKLLRVGWGNLWLRILG